MWWWLASCEDPDAPPVRPPVTDEPCAPDPDNVLRIVCAWSRERPGPVSLRVAESGAGAARVFAGAEDELEARIVAWDLLADTLYDWSLTDGGEVVAEGTLRTRRLPDEVDLVVDVEVDGPSAVDRLLVPAACGTQGHLVVLDREGRVRWYQPTGTPNTLTAIDASDRGTVLALVGRVGVREWAFDGTLVADAEGADDGLDRKVHHAVVGRDGRTLVLDTEPLTYPDGGTYLMDGVTEVGVGHVWGLDEVMDPQGWPSIELPSYWGAFFPDAFDFAHGNGLSVEADGSWLITLKHLHTVANVGVDGQIAWAVSGGPSVPPFPDTALALSSSAGLDAAFEYPHTPVRSPWGTVLLMDNGLMGQTSRVVELDVDPSGGNADLVRAWELDASCPVQSSVVGLPDGTVLAACTRSREIFELDDDGIRRRSTVRCRSGAAAGNLTRVAPIAL